ncbi:MAG: DUF1343 domain-containing protein [Spirochaetales bacterium]|nr:DUF1343 domain-containing protein [Spirochaetales bacterium]
MKCFFQFSLLTFLGPVLVSTALCNERSGESRRFSVKTRLTWEKKSDGRIVVYSLPRSAWPRRSLQSQVLPNRSEQSAYSGLDSLSIDEFALLRNRKYALLTNATGLDRNMQTGLALMRQAGVPPALVFEPEHGLYSHKDEILPDGIRFDKKMGVKVLSLYGKHKKPAPYQLRDIDLIVVDIQNLPVRCYTYITTLTYIMEAANRMQIEVMVLDRPNPFGFWKAQGSQLSPAYVTFVSTAPVPFLYSLTPGEYAIYMAATRFFQLPLSVVRVAGYSRDQVDGALRQAWINPSPNIPSLESALVYAGVVFLEGTNMSAGRGTSRPFVYSGAPWLKSDLVVAELSRLNLPGVQFAEVFFEPTASVYKGQTVRGVQILPVSVDFDPVRTAYEYLRIVRRFHHEFEMRNHRGTYFMDHIWGGPQLRRSILEDRPYAEFKARWAQEAREFEDLVQPFRLY